VADLHLLEKKELRIERIRLENANLNHIAAAVADSLGIDLDKVLVTDVREDAVTLDVFQDTVNLDGILGKRRELLERLAQLPGVRVTEATSFSSDGVLGWIALDPVDARQPLARSEKMAEQIRQKLSRRAIIFSTGSEVAAGLIEDTNTPTIARRLEAEGYSVTAGPTLRDDAVLIAGKLGQAVYDDGHGLIVTTGGVGAEEKDCTVEAVLELDPDAATPYIAKFQKGTGRHCKDGVRIAVGQVSDAIVVALPGPNDEVRASLDALADGLKRSLSTSRLAEAIASTLRQKLSEKMAKLNSHSMTSGSS
jgi:molybdenum cofactor synthesis domain-containing protein